MEFVFGLALVAITNRMKDVTGRFNSLLDGKLIINLDEMENMDYNKRDKTSNKMKG